MEKIKQVTEADVGRVAISLNGDYRVKLLGISNDLDGSSHVEFLVGTSMERVVGQTSNSFGLIGGANAMYWEDEAKAIQPATAFESWCAEKGYDPKGWFVYDMDLSVLEELCLPVQNKFKIQDDDTTTCPRFIDESGFAHYEYFNSPHHGVVLKQATEEKLAKPRFHKKRQKPPVRQKTDIVIHYKTGQSYTIKNINSLSVSDQGFIINMILDIESGIVLDRTYTIEVNLVDVVVVKSPNEVVEIQNFHENGFSVFFNKGFATVTQWFKSF